MQITGDLLTVAGSDADDVFTVSQDGSLIVAVLMQG